MKVNKVIRILILSDFYLCSGFGFISPIFAIFLTQQISGGNIEMVGFAAAVYWIVKSALQIPIGRYLDKNHGEKDDFYFLITGIIIAGMVPFGYIASSLPWHIYLLQALYGLGMAMYIPAWYGLFIRHADKGKEAMEGAMESTAMGIGAGVTGALGGILVSVFDFKMLFILVGIVVIVGGLIPILFYKRIKGRGEVDKQIIKEKL